MSIFISLIALLCIMLGALVFFQNRQASYSKLFGLMCLSSGFWVLSNYFVSSELINLDANGLFNRIAYLSGFCVVFFGLLFSYNFPEKRNVSKLELCAVVIVGLFTMALSFTDLIAGGVAKNDSGSFTFEIGRLLGFYIISYMFMIGLIIKNYVINITSVDKRIRLQSIMILLAFFASAMTGILLNAVFPFLTGDWSTAKYSYIAIIILIFLTAYAITKYGLFDIKLAAVRALVYILSLGLLALIYYYLSLIISSIFLNVSDLNSSVTSPLNVVLALFLAFIFQPIRRFFDKITNRFFYRDTYNIDDFYSRINKTLTTTNDLRDLLRLAAHDIAEALKSEQVFFFIHTVNDHFVSAGTEKHRHLPKKDAIMLDGFNDFKNGLVIQSTLDSKDPIRRMLVSHRIELVLPLKHVDQTIGYLCLGSHLVTDYSVRDLKVLTTIADELVIAIQNALSIQEVKDLNSGLQQRIESATQELRATNAQLQRLDKAKDEFVSMASHQLRTPLTSIKGYVSMILDGDVGEINETMHHMLEEAYLSSERMVRLINDFLSMSRIQTGKFLIEKSLVDLSEIVKQEIDSLRSGAVARGLDFTYKKPVDFPKIMVDEGKIRQVIMNFADNAIYYSKTSGKIEIILESNRDGISFMVKDHGIGVPITEQAQLFSKFFRATNAKTQRPDGTGVGLYLAKRIVDAHSGKIIFKSIEGKGSTFGFSLPFKQD